MRAHSSLIVNKSVEIVIACAFIVPGVMFGSARPVAAQDSQQFSCETPATVSNEVRAAYEEHYQCTEKAYDAWFSKYPVEIAQLQNLYLAWQSSRRHDLRGQESAEQWVLQYPVNFSMPPVELSKEQVLEVSPTQSGEPVQVNGEFERLYVDRDNRTLFLTSQEEGRVSISIAARYAFELEGKVGKSGARDFFVLDQNTALIEEVNARGGNRDLVVLDISDRSAPHEVARIRGIVPEVGGAMRFHPGMMSSPPTFEQYRSIRDGEMSSPASCVASPAMFKVKPGVHCRPDGTCLERKVVSEPVGICTPVVVESKQDSLKRPARRPVDDLASKDDGQIRDERSDDVKSQATDSAPARVQSGEGRAGGLKQMMVFNQTLYVLSGSSKTSHGILTTFDLSDRKNPRIREVIDLNNGPEALQRHDNLLLIAGRDAVITVSLGVESRPRLIGEFRQRCAGNRNPIVMRGGIGYRTMIGDGRGVDCASRLEVLDLSQPHQPVLRATYPLQQPRGLSVLGHRLFVADEYQGVVVFDIDKPVNPALVGTWSFTGVKDLVLSDFDLYAMSGSEVQMFYVGPLYERGSKLARAFGEIDGIQTVVRVSEAVAEDKRH